MKTFGKVVLYLTLVVAVCAVTTGRPPAIVRQPAKDVFFVNGEAVELPCEAEGSPVPVYTWKRNGIDFNSSGFDDRVYQERGVGTLVFVRPKDTDQGMYQCFATNAHGVSLSVTVKLLEATLKNFEVKPDREEFPELGHELTLNCVPPESVPPPMVFWVLHKPEGGYDVVSLDARVSMDQEYRLRFANVRRSDREGGRTYACLVLNSISRRSARGPGYSLNPTYGTEQWRPVTYMWASPEDHFGIKGDNLTLKCIFAGNPTPEVHWERTDGQPLSDRATVRSFGQELVISDLQDGDAGSYRCWATNNNTLTPVNRTISVRVESRPEWVEEPRDMEMAVGDTANITCLADSVPQPTMNWFVNGVPLLHVTDPRLTDGRVERVSPSNVVFSNLTRGDSLVLQCNATNKLGYAWADFILHVGATTTTTTTMTTTPENDITTEERSTMSVVAVAGGVGAAVVVIIVVIVAVVVFRRRTGKRDGQAATDPHRQNKAMHGNPSGDYYLTPVASHATRHEDQLPYDSLQMSEVGLRSEYSVVGRHGNVSHADPGATPYESLRRSDVGLTSEYCEIGAARVQVHK